MSDWPAAASARLPVAARVIASAALDGVVTMSHLPSAVLSLRSPHGGPCVSAGRTPWSPHGGNFLCRTVTRKVGVRVLAPVGAWCLPLAGALCLSLAGARRLP